MNHDAITACLLGGALGDSIGLPSEGMRAARIARLRSGPLQQCLIGKSGMVSDDTEHAVMTLLSLREAGYDADCFARKLASRLRWWLASVPAGIGLATAKSIIRLWLGFRPSRSGVRSAGNGPLMRAPVIGVRFANDENLRNRFTDASTLITHRDPRALECARMIALVAAIAANNEQPAPATEILDALDAITTSEEMRTRLQLLRGALLRNDSVTEFADSFSAKKGYVTGFAPDSAAVAIHAWLRHRNDFRATIEEVIRAGGDTDTTAFITGSIAAIECGSANLPEDWLKGLRDWPINRSLLAKIGDGKRCRYPVWPLSLIRNSAFFIIVLCHGFRRLFLLTESLHEPPQTQQISQPSPPAQSGEDRHHA